MSTYLSDRFRLPSFLLFSLILLVGYVLSSGPVHALYSSQRLQGPVPADLVTFYKPLNWLYEHTPLGKPMAVHDDWWKRVMTRS